MPPAGVRRAVFPLSQFCGEGFFVAPWFPRHLHGLCDPGDTTMLALVCLHRSLRFLHQTVLSAPGERSTIPKVVRCWPYLFVAPILEFHLIEKKQFILLCFISALFGRLAAITQTEEIIQFPDTKYRNLHVTSP